MSFLDYRDYPSIVDQVELLVRCTDALAVEAVNAIGFFSPSPEIYIMDDIRLFILPAVWQGKRINEAELNDDDYRQWKPAHHGETLAQRTKVLAGLLTNPAVVSAMYSCSMPGCEIVPHIDRESAIGKVLRLHLGLRCPTGCALTVDGEERPWSDGEVLFFDSARVEHSAHNRSGQPRMILIVDFDREMIEAKKTLTNDGQGERAAMAASGGTLIA